jgi:hypothetical protein
MKPLKSERNLKPTSTEAPSPESIMAGVALAFQTEQHVLKIHDTVEAMGLPDVSLTPPLPPVITALYVATRPNGVVGAKVAVRVLALYVTDAGTTLLEGSSKRKVVLVTVVGSRALSKVALTAVDELTPVDPGSGTVEVTVGPEPPRVVEKTTSTQ